MIDSPLRFTPILVPKVWGGTRLASLGKNIPGDEQIGESWELADMPGDGPCSIVAEGHHAGTTLRELLNTNQTDIMGSVPLNAQDRFPLLIKFLDACENLSVQVHPDQQWASTHPDAYLKSEAWVVVDAAAGSRIWAGVVPGTTAASMHAALDSDTLTEVLEWRDAIVGASHNLPSGTCHALGKGVLVAEVQTTSDTTFRLWDWGRQGRTMHVDEALACINFDSPPPAEVPTPTIAADGTTDTILAETPWFIMRRLDAVQPATAKFPLSNAPAIIM
ncbi:MAG: class I mannose-6-phosphate isomerase, partial [Phycisphaerales bacterium]|nr:class I mannose-6-phosphate isomerase [Phycisphaerales bacterium]